MTTPLEFAYYHALDVQHEALCQIHRRPSTETAATTEAWQVARTAADTAYIALQREQNDALADDETDELPARIYCYVVAVFLCDQAYGGPEEGGWYFDCGTRSTEHAPHTQIFSNEGAARDYRETLQALLDATDNEGRREISSVLSEGQYRAVVWYNYAPTHFPAERPHYE